MDTLSRPALLARHGEQTFVGMRRQSVIVKPALPPPPQPNRIAIEEYDQGHCPRFEANTVTSTVAGGSSHTTEIGA